MSSQAARELAYEKNRKFIYQMVHKFLLGMGYEKDDFHMLLSEAHSGFMKACETWNPEMGKFITWVGHCVWNSLRQFHDARMKHLERFKQVEEIGGEARTHFSVRSLMGEVSEDAQTVLRLVLDMPADIQHILLGKEVRETTTTIRCALVRCLQDAGWHLKKIADVFLEVRRALYG